MRFAVATVQFWNSKGFDTAHWRRNADGTKALVHLEFAKVLVSDIDSNENVTVYDAPSDCFDTLLNDEEWAV